MTARTYPNEDFAELASNCQARPMKPASLRALLIEMAKQVLALEHDVCQMSCKLIGQGEKNPIGSPSPLTIKPPPLTIKDETGLIEIALDLAPRLILLRRALSELLHRV